jgi:hypothetical protein
MDYNYINLGSTFLSIISDNPRFYFYSLFECNYLGNGDIVLLLLLVCKCNCICGTL